MDLINLSQSRELLDKESPMERFSDLRKYDVSSG